MPPLELPASVHTIATDVYVCAVHLRERHPGAFAIGGSLPPIAGTKLRPLPDEVVQFETVFRNMPRSIVVMVGNIAAEQDQQQQRNNSI